MAHPLPTPGTPDPSVAALFTAASDRQLLATFRDTMNSAHQAVMSARRVPADPAGLRHAREAHLLAMTQYELALEKCRLPVPPQLHRESRLLRRLLA